MAVLVEAISVVVRRAAIDAKLPGGWTAFAAHAPNRTLCADGEIAWSSCATRTERTSS